MPARSTKSPNFQAWSPLGTLRLLAGDILRQVRSHAPYSPDEVRARLRQSPSPTDPRIAVVHAAAAEIGAWVHLLPPDAHREEYLGLAASRLPTVVFWYCQGMSAREIGRRLTPFGESCYGDRAIDAACALIAEALNRRAGRERGWRTPMSG